ncbi:hypothetical protein ACWGLF_35525 [Streptomyces puniciscabiei]
MPIQTRRERERAVQGFADLAAELRQARTAAPGTREALAAVARTYTSFARRRPALYALHEGLSAPEEARKALRSRRWGAP